MQSCIYLKDQRDCHYFHERESREEACKWLNSFGACRCVVKIPVGCDTFNAEMEEQNGKIDSRTSED
jgi:hypothetical protein